jgi:hypothetical protein
MFASLVWKDFRLAVSPVIMIIVSILACFGLAALVFVSDSSLTSSNPRLLWSIILVSGGYFGACASIPTLGILSGTILANERADRSIEMLSYLPLTRTQIYASKLAVAGVISVATFWVLLSAIAIGHILAGSSELVRSLPERFPAIAWFAASYLLVLAVGLTTSSVSTSSGACTLTAFIAPVALQITAAVIQRQIGLLTGIDSLYVFVAASIIISGLLLFFSWWHFARRELI